MGNEIEKEAREKDSTERLVQMIKESSNVLLVAGLTAIVVWLTFQIPVLAVFLMICGAGFKIVARVLEKLFLGSK